MCLPRDWRANRDLRKFAADLIWHGEHHTSHHRLMISQRADRHRLLSMYEHSKQIIHIKMSLFGDLPLPQPATIPPSSDILTKAVAFLQPLAEAYASGPIADIGELKKHNDEKIAEQGLAVTSRMG
jgi:hypothetical protein